MGSHLLRLDADRDPRMGQRVIDALNGDWGSALLKGLIDSNDRGRVASFLEIARRELGGSAKGADYEADVDWAVGVLESVLKEVAERLPRDRAFRSELLVGAARGPHTVAVFLRSTEAVRRFDRDPTRSTSIGERGWGYLERSLDAVSGAICDWVIEAGPSVYGSIEVEALGASLRASDEILKKLDAISAHQVQSGTGGITANKIVREYGRFIADRAPTSLADRQTEINSLRILRGNALRLVAWRGKEKAGKSGLMYTVARDGLDDLEIVPYFVRAREIGQSSRRSFVHVTGAYLACLAGALFGPSEGGGFEDEILWRELLERAAFQTRLRGRTLVLLVDGLDEDEALHIEAASIAGILPDVATMRALGIGVIVSTRPNPPVPDDVPAEHWLREDERWTDLAPRPEAEMAVDPSEIDELMRTDAGARVAGYLAAARTPLSIADLSHLTGESTVRVRDLIHRRRGRNLVPVRSDRIGRGYELGHEQTLEQIVRNLVPAFHDVRDLRDSDLWVRAYATATAPFRASLHAGARAITGDNWALASPYFLDAAYIAMAIEDGEQSLAAQISTDPGRIKSLVARGSGYSEALDQIHQVLRSFTSATHDDLTLLARLLIAKEHLESIIVQQSYERRVAGTITGADRRASALRSTWIATESLGEVREDWAARVILSPSHSITIVRPLESLLDSIEGGGDVPVLHDTAATIRLQGPVGSHRSERSWELTAVQVGSNFYRRRGPGIAARFFRALGRPWAEARAHHALAEHAMAAGDRDAAVDLCSAAITAASDEASARCSFVALDVAEMSLALGAPVLAERALTIAKEIALRIPRHPERDDALVRLAEHETMHRRYAGAIETVDRIGTPWSRSSAWARVASASALACADDLTDVALAQAASKPSHVKVETIRAVQLFLAGRKAEATTRLAEATREVSLPRVLIGFARERGYAGDWQRAHGALAMLVAALPAMSAPRRRQVRLQIADTAADIGQSSQDSSTPWQLVGAGWADAARALAEISPDLHSELVARLARASRLAAMSMEPMPTARCRSDRERSVTSLAQSWIITGGCGSGWGEITMHATDSVETHLQWMAQFFDALA